MVYLQNYLREQGTENREHMGTGEQRNMFEQKVNRIEQCEQDLNKKEKRRRSRILMIRTNKLERTNMKLVVVNKVSNIGKIGSEKSNGR